MALKVKTFDITVAVLPIIFMAVGISVIYSLVLGTNSEGMAIKQGVIALIGIGAMLAVSFSDYRFFRGISWITYLITVILLVLVNYFGKTTNGAMNWLDLGFFQLQPSELAKIFLTISLSSYFAPLIGKVKWSHIFYSLLLLAVPLVLVLKEPDLGTAVVIMFIYITILLLAKLSFSKIAIIFSIIAAVFTIGILAYLNVKPFGAILHDYQRDRITVFLKPDSDPYGRGYNVTQAKITVGSGGIIGNGLGKGTQSQLQFLPEPHTDFIFAGIAESYGFLGSFVLLGLYCYFIIRIIEIGSLARDNFGMLIVSGIAAMFFCQVLISVGMNLGLLPVTGIPLPFLSSGGTSLLISLFAVGLVESIYIRHKKISF